MKIGKALGRYFKDYIKQDILVRLEMSRIIQEDVLVEAFASPFILLTI